MGTPCDKIEIKVLPSFVKSDLIGFRNEIGNPLLDFRYGYR